MLEVFDVREGAGLPAVTHVDGTARVQTVDAVVMPRFHGLLRAFERVAGVPVLTNTSFNVKGEPIVDAPYDAFTCFVRSGLDALAIEGFLVSREEVAVPVADLARRRRPASKPRISRTVYTLM